MVAAGFVLTLGATQLRPHVDFPRFQPGCRVDYPVHYGIGVHAPAEPSMPVLLLVLGAEYGGLSVASQLRELHQHAPCSTTSPPRSI